MNRKESENAINYALSQGADSCEIYQSESSSSSVQMRMGEISDCNFSGQSGYSVRLIKDGKPGFAYGTVADEANLRRSVDDALISSAFLEADENYFFTSPGQIYREISVEEEKPVSFAEKKEMLSELTASAMECADIAKTERASLSETRSSVRIMNSLGLELTGGNHYVSATAAVLAKAGEEEQLGGEFQLATCFQGLDMKKLGQRAAADAAEKIGAKPLDSCTLPVIFRPEAVADLLSLLLPSFMGSRVLKGMSRLSDQLGETVAAKGVSLYDDAFLADAVIKTAFDDEGQPCGRHALIENGVAKEFLYNNKYGRRAGKSSTGNGFCSSHAGLPSVTDTNFCLAAGDTPLADMYAFADKVLEVKDLMGLHMADSVSGDFSLGAGGRLTEHGKQVQRVRGVMVAGNLFELLKDIIAVGNDVRSFGYGSAPSILIKSLKISGK